MFAIVTLLVVAGGAAAAYALRWTTDDAFISFRYARNLVDGHGLVFNAGERVEGFTNLLWTLWCAAGLRAGVAAETWSNAWGLACYASSILLLALHHRQLAARLGAAAAAVPFAALLAAAHRDWAAWSVSGLETGAFALLLLAGFLVVVRDPSAPVRLAGAGALFALAALTRPDGVLPAVVGGGFVLLAGRPRWKAAAIYGAAFAVLWLPVTLWRVGYYGEFFPNTYYAKSAYLPWYGQGLRYVLLYFEKYWALLVGPALLAASLIAGRRGAPDSTPGQARIGREAGLAAAIALAYTAYVVRVGGDFMFARFMIPATPFLALLGGIGWLRVFRGRTVAGWAAALAVAAAMWLTPLPVSGTEWRHGVADERGYYSPERVAGLDHWAEVLGRYFRGLPVRVAFYGDEARIVYRAGFPVAIEAHTGLTDREVARQPLTGRGRVGHEKLASAAYLIERRRVHFTFSDVPRRSLRLRDWIPEVIVRFDDDVYGQVLHWDPALMAELRRRGAAVPDFPALLDRYLGAIDGLPPERVARDHERFRRFYFDHVDDPAREEPFRRRLSAR